MIHAVGEDQALHLVIVTDAVVPAGGVEDPVADIHHVEKTAELLFRQFDIHNARLLRKHTVCNDYNRSHGKMP